MDTYYDKQADILVLVLEEAVPVRFQHTGAVSIALDEQGRVVEIEIAQASKNAPLSLTGSAPHADNNTKPLSELAPLAGVSVETMKKALQAGRLEGFKAGKTWFSSLRQVLHWRATVKPAGRPAAPTGSARIFGAGETKPAPGSIGASVRSVSWDLVDVDVQGRHIGPEAPARAESRPKASR